MNIHITRTTRFQPWNQQTIFGEFPLFIKSGNLTVTLLFHDTDSIELVRSILAEMLH